MRDNAVRYDCIVIEMRNVDFHGSFRRKRAFSEFELVARGKRGELRVLVSLLMFCINKLKKHEIVR